MNARTIAYWATTGLVSLAVLGSGAGKLMGAEPLTESMIHLGFPTYVMPLLGVWYVGAAITWLAPGLPRLKEWAYAGFAFAMSGALVSHLAVGDAVAQFAPVLVLGGLAAASYALRPASRRLTPATTAQADEPALMAAR